MNENAKFVIDIVIEIVTGIVNATETGIGNVADTEKGQW